MSSWRSVSTTMPAHSTFRPVTRGTVGATRPYSAYEWIFEYSVAALVFGCFVFLMLSTKTLRHLKRIDCAVEGVAPMPTLSFT